LAHVKEKGNNADRWDSRPLPRLQPGCTAFLSAVGLRVEAEWLVKRIVPTNGRALEKEGFDAAIGRAPSVYDPGGLTALALRIDSPYLRVLSLTARRPSVTASGAQREPAPVDRIARCRAPSTRCP